MKFLIKIKLEKKSISKIENFPYDIDLRSRGLSYENIYSMRDIKLWIGRGGLEEFQNIRKYLSFSVGIEIIQKISKSTVH